MDGLRLFDGSDVQVHHHWVLAAAHEHALQQLIRGVDFLMRDVRRDVDEVPWASFCQKLQAFAPAHAGLSLDDVNDRLKPTVVVPISGLTSHPRGVRGIRN